MGQKYKNPPVYFVIGQVQHNPLLNLSSYLPVIQERMRREGYPDFKRTIQVQFQLAPSLTMGDELEQETTQPSAQRVERYIFSDITNTSGFLLQANSLSFRTTEYKSFESFSGHLQLGLKILDEAVGGLSFYERLGMRYLDAISAREGEDLNQYLARELTGLPARIPDGIFSHSFSEAVLLAEGVGQVVLRTITRNAQLGFPPDLPPEGLKLNPRFAKISGEHAMIDTDGIYLERQPYDAADIQKRLGDIHDLIGKCFEATVTDYARSAWNE